MPVTEIQGTPSYQGEVQLLRWGDNSTNGMTVTLALNGVEEGEGHPFKGLGTGKQGQQFMAVLVPVTESPPQASDGDAGHHSIPSEPVAGSGGASSKTPQGSQARTFNDMTPAQQAGMMCQDPEFRRWLHEQRGMPEGAEVALFVRRMCGVESRRDIVAGAPAGRRWSAIISEYRAWQTEQRYEGMMR